MPELISTLAPSVLRKQQGGPAVHRAQGTARSVDQPNLGATDLPGAQPAAELSDGFDDEKDSAHAGMIGGQATPIGIDRQVASRSDSSSAHEVASFAGLAKSQILEGG